MDGALQVLKVGNVDDCIASLWEMRDRKDYTFFSIDLANTLGLVLHRFTTQIILPKQDSEKMLALIGVLVDKAEDKHSLVFVHSKIFIESLVNLTTNYLKDNLNQLSKLNSSFQSHYCYELTIYAILCLLENSTSIRTFLRSVHITTTMKLIENLSQTIETDQMYLTQELALEIILRICHYYNRIDRVLYENILKMIPLEISSSIRNPAVGIANLLRNMRDVLNLINENNPHVKSIPISEFRLKSSELVNAKERIFETSGYLDICKEYICFSVTVDNRLIRFPFDSIKRVHFATEVISAQFLLESCPEKLNSLLAENERSPPGKCPTMTFYFNKNHETMMQVMSLIETRLNPSDTAQHTPWKDINYTPDVYKGAGTTLRPAKWNSNVSDTFSVSTKNTTCPKEPTKPPSRVMFTTPLQTSSSATTRWLNYPQNSNSKVTMDAKAIGIDTVFTTDSPGHQTETVAGTPLIVRDKTVPIRGRVANVLGGGAFVPKNNNNSVFTQQQQQQQLQQQLNPTATSHFTTSIHSNDNIQNNNRSASQWEAPPQDVDDCDDMSCIHSISAFTPLIHRNKQHSQSSSHIEKTQAATDYIHPSRDVFVVNTTLSNTNIDNYFTPTMQQHQDDNIDHRNSKRRTTRRNRDALNAQYIDLISDYILSVTVVVTVFIACSLLLWKIISEDYWLGGLN